MHYALSLCGKFGTGKVLNDIYDFDMALLKEFKFTESKELQLRFEVFNIFNHAQFTNPTGNILSSTFGFVTSARNPRIMQIAMKFVF